MRTRLTAFAGVLAAVTVQAADWEHWRGPFFNGSTNETGLPATWSTERGIAWTAPMPGPSAATPIVSKGRVFVSSAVDQADDLLAICLDAATGKELWRQRIGRNQKAMGNNNMASPSACADGRVVYFYYGTGDLAAFDFNGKRLWGRQLQADHGEFVLKYGYSSSPLYLEGRLFIPVLQNKQPDRYHASDRKGPLDSFLLAIDAATGKDLWKRPRETDATDESTEAYITPIPFQVEGRTDIVVVGGEFVTGHNPRDGGERWRWEFSPHDRRRAQRLIPSVVPGDSLLYAIRPKGRPVYALAIRGTGRLGDSCIVWKHEEATSDSATPLYYRGRLYVLNSDRKTMYCFDGRTGELQWKGRLEGRSVFRASPTGTDGKVYCLSEGGDVVVLAAGDAFTVLSRIPMGGRGSRASIAAAGGRLFIRTNDALTCVGAP